MIETPTVTTTKAQKAAVIRLGVPFSDLPKVMGPAIGEVMKAVSDQGLTPAGAWFVHVLQVTKNGWDFDVGVPLSQDVKPVGRVKKGALPAATIARTVYTGPYEGLSEAWGAFDAWVDAEGHQKAGEFWDAYEKGRESGVAPSGYVTALHRVLASTAAKKKPAKKKPAKKAKKKKAPAAKKKPAKEKKKAPASKKTATKKKKTATKKKKTATKKKKQTAKR